MLASHLLSRTAFWDIKFETVSLEKDASVVIPKVFDHGTIEDIRAVWKYYDHIYITKILTTTAYLTNQGLAMASLLLDRSPDTFLCFVRKQSHHALWPY